MFEFFRENNFISRNKSGFKPGESCINQLLFITHKISKLFENSLDVAGAAITSLDITSYILYITYIITYIYIYIIN